MPEVKAGVRSVNYVPNPNFSGTDTFTVQIQDNNADVQKAGEDSLTINIVIKPVNDLPTLTAPAIFPVKGGVPATFDVTVGDVETPVANLVVTCAGSGSSFPKGSITLTGTGTTRTVHLSPSATTKITTSSLTLTVTDGNKGHASAKVAVTVSP